MQPRIIKKKVIVAIDEILSHDFQDITFSDVLPIRNVHIYVIEFLSAIGCDTKFCWVLTNPSQVNKHLVPYFRVRRIF